MTEAGQILDNTYRLVRLVAEGGMGLVYEATHMRLSGRYAIKVLPPRWSKDPDALARFDREARISSSLQHPNIVQIIDFNTAADGTEYLVMEFLRGETLAARMARVGPLPLASVISIVEQIASGLAAAHAHGIVHRDLKPENVLLTQVEGWEGDWAKILDFGISKVNSLDTISPGSRGVIGTPQYMAPEQCEGRTEDVNAATDQFALAVITYEMLTGHRPFAGASLGDVLCNVLNAEPPAMNIDPGLEAVVLRGLAKANGERHASVTAFAEALRDAALATGAGPFTRRTEESASQSYTAGELKRATTVRTARRGRRAVAIVAAAAACTLVAALVLQRARGGAASTLAGLSAAVADSLGLIMPPASARPAPAPATPAPAQAATSEVADATAAAATAQPVRDEGPVADEPEPARASASQAGVAPARVTAARAPAAGARAVAARSHARAAAPSVRARSVPAPRPQQLAAATWTAPSRPATEPPALKPLPLDDDAILPLDEKFND